MIAFAIACGVVAILCTILWSKLSGKNKRFQKQYSHVNGRPVGPTENIWRMLHDKNGSLLIAYTLVLRSKKPLQATVVKKAMELLTVRHPMLCMCVRKNPDGDYCLQKMDKVQVDLRQLDDQDWHHVMEENLLEKFDGENGPLWRVTLLPNARYKTASGRDDNDMALYPHECICIFSFHHIVIDGASRNKLFAEFINYVNKLSSNEEPKVTTMPMLPPFHVYLNEAVKPKWYLCLLATFSELLCFLPGFAGFVMGLVVERGRKGNIFIKKHGLEIQRNPQIQPRTKIIPLEFTKDMTSSLLKKCKEHQTTVQGAIQTAGGVSMVTMLEEQQCEIEFNVTVNTRPYFKSKVPNEYVGAYVSRLQCKNTFVTSPDADKFWCMAKNTSKDIHARLKKNEHMEMAIMFDCMGPLLSQFLSGGRNRDKKSGERSRQLMGYNNFGYCKFLDRSPNDDVILRATFGCTAQHQQGTIFANNVATFNGQLFWTVAYYSNITSDATAQRYADLVKETILKAIMN